MAGELTLMRLVVAAALLAFFSVEALADGCRSETFEETDYTVCSYDLATTDLRVFWRRTDGTPYATFSALAEDLGAGNRSLAFAMNGGMYQDDLAPVGLLVVEGKELKSANTVMLSPDIKPVPNFYKKPNGIFFLGGGKAAGCRARPKSTSRSPKGSSTSTTSRDSSATVSAATTRSSSTAARRPV